MVDCEGQEEVDELWDKLSEGGEEGPCGWLKDRYGVPWVVELTGIIGHYGFVTGMLNAFEMMPAPDAEKLPT